MKKTSFFKLIILALTFVMISCGKDETSTPTPPDNTIQVTFKVDGVLKQLKVTSGIYVRDNQLPGAIHGEFREKVKTEQSPYLQFNITHQPNRFSNTYIFENNTDKSGVGVMYYSDLGPDHSQVYSTLGLFDPAGVKDFRFAITELTDTHVRGTFSGSVYYRSSTTVLSKKITEGAFYLNLLK